MLPKPLSKQTIILGYCLIFYLLLLLKLTNGQLLFQQKPAFFLVRPDVFTYVLLLVNVHHFILNQPVAWALLDTLFYAMPLVYITVYKYKRNASSVVAIAMLLINWLYVHFCTLYTLASIEMQIGWLLFPILFIPKKETTFYLLSSGLRYYFLFLFASAGIWKIAQHGIFNFYQLSNILLIQHKEILVAQHQWYQSVIYWLIDHPIFSYSIYVSATLLELAFAIGFLTKKYDWVLAIAAIIFIISDYALMRIVYFEWLPFLLLLWYKRPLFQHRSIIS